MKNLQVGEAKVSIVNLGHLSFKLKDVDNVPESEWKPNYSDVFENSRLYPSQCVHVLLPNASILVDAGDYARFASQDSEYTPKDYKPPPGLIEQLARAGVGVESITHVVITHAHYDHYSGVTTKKDDGTLVPAFPNARYFLGKADWTDEETQKALKDPASEDSKTLGALNKSRLLELVEGNLELLPGVRILAAPGESAGHQILKVSSFGHTLYCVGDLFHDPVEIENPSWMATWANAQTNLKSRESLIKASLQENAIIVASHMPVGKLENAEKGAKFVPLVEFL